MNSFFHTSPAHKMHEEVRVRVLRCVREVPQGSSGTWNCHPSIIGAIWLGPRGSELTRTLAVYKSPIGFENQSHSA